MEGKNRFFKYHSLKDLETLLAENHWGRIRVQKMHWNNEHT